jgi:uncharacterized membrane protein YvlD (DUF360 family)
MRFSIRFISNAMASYLALYLVDSLARGRFVIGGVWIAVLLALLLAVLNSFIKPLHRLRTRTARSLVIAALTLAMNMLVLQVFAWTTPLHSAGPQWVLLVAVFISVLDGGINHLVGFESPKKTRPGTSSVRQEAEKAAPKRPTRPSGSDHPGGRSARRWFRRT